MQCESTARCDALCAMIRVGQQNKSVWPANGGGQKRPRVTEAMPGIRSWPPTGECKVGRGSEEIACAMRSSQGMLFLNGCAVSGVGEWMIILGAPRRNARNENLSIGAELRGSAAGMWVTQVWQLEDVDGAVSVQ